MQAQRAAAYGGQAASSGAYGPSWQAAQQQVGLSQHQQQQQQGHKELEALVQQLTPLQRQHLAAMPPDKRMQFFTNLRSQMARAQQLQQQQQAGAHPGAWQQGVPAPMRHQGGNAQTASQVIQLVFCIASLCVCRVVELGCLLPQIGPLVPV